MVTFATGVSRRETARSTSEEKPPGTRAGFREAGKVTRALVVHHDASIVEREAAILRAAGYIVDTCAGPSASCPVLDNRPCPQAERADVLVYGIGLLPDRRSFRRFVDRLRGLYGDKALVLLSDEKLSPVLEGEDHEPGMRETRRAGPSRGVIHVYGRPTGETLELAIEEALGAR
jgi:hypothetical protein